MSSQVTRFPTIHHKEDHRLPTIHPQVIQTEVTQLPSITKEVAEILSAHKKNWRVPGRVSGPSQEKTVSKSNQYDIIKKKREIPLCGTHGREIARVNVFRDSFFPLKHRDKFTRDALFLDKESGFFGSRV